MSSTHRLITRISNDLELLLNVNLPNRNISR